MRVAFYLHYTALKAGGIFTYSIGILKLFVKINSIKEIILIYSSDQKEYLAPYFNEPKITPLLIDRNSLLNRIRFGLSYFFLDISFIYQDQIGESFLKRILIKFHRLFNPYTSPVTKSADVLYVPMQFSPVYHLRIPVITTLHDVQELHYPEFFSSGERMHRAINTKKAAELSDRVIVSFDHVKNDLLKFFEIAEEKISVCMPPANLSWFLSEEISNEDKVRAKYSIRGDFLLLPAATWRHKNHTAVIKAIKMLKEEGVNIGFVSTGNKTGYYSEIEKLYNDLGLNGQVVFPGIIDESDLIALYRAAKLVVIPTLYEAGSGPLFEAFKYGAPVICSNVTSLPDTMRNPEYIFDPTDVESIANLIRKALTDPKFLQENIEHGKRRLEYFNSIDYSEAFIRVILNSGG